METCPECEGNGIVCSNCFCSIIDEVCGCDTPPDPTTCDCCNGKGELDFRYADTDDLDDDDDRDWLEDDDDWDEDE